MIDENSIHQIHDAELHNYTKVELGNDRYIYYGNVMNDRKNRFFDGEEIRTSLVMKELDGIVYTMNTRYKLVD